MSGIVVTSALRTLAKPYRARIGLLVALGVLAGLCEGVGISLFLPLLHSMDPAGFGGEAGGELGRWYNRLFEGVDPASRMQVVLGAMFVLLATKAALNAVNGLLFARLDALFVDDLRRRVLDQALRVDLGFVERYRTGELITTLQSQTWETSGALGTLVGIVIRLATVAVLGTALLLISWKLTLGVAVALLLISWAIRRISARVDHLSELGLLEWNGLAQRCVEVLRGLRTTRAFGREDFESERFAKASKATSEAFLRVERLRALVDPFSEFMVAALLTVVLLFSLRDPSRLPAVLTFMFILFRLQPQVQRLDAARVQLASTAAPVRAVAGFVDPEGKPYLPRESGSFDGVRDAIEIDDVTFRYDAMSPENAALRSVTARIPAQRTTAIVGPSGSGKSTLVYLLMRFADPTAGAIRIDGTPLHTLDLDAWRAGIGFVSQDAHIFQASVADNIRYGRSDATDDDVRRAAKRAHADTFIESLPDGYETILGEEGLELSGGQRQRIALARALVRGAGILVLDEATNALDAIAETVIQGALDELAGQHTLIVIAHRLATVEKADHVLVLDGGSLVEEGEHAALLAQDGLFSRLHRLQVRRTP